MANYKTPGVYVQEIPNLPASVAPVATAVPAFVGFTRSHLVNVEEANVPNMAGTNKVSKPTLIYSLREYVDLYGGPWGHLDVTLDASDQVTGVADLNYSQRYSFYYAIKLYFLNGGGPCYIVSAGANINSGAGLPINGFLNAIRALELFDEVTLISIPEISEISGGSSNYNTTIQELLTHCGAMQDRFALIDLEKDSNGAVTNTQVTNFRNGSGLNDLDYGAAYAPYLETVLDWEYDYDQIIITGGTIVAGSDLQGKIDNGANDGYVREVKAGIAAARDGIILAPTAAVAGAIVRTDKNRGVWKAPANISLNGIVKPTSVYRPSELEDLNDPTDGAGKAINVIRPVTGRGILVMGARTLMANSLEWRYVPVRRLFIFVEESIKKAMENVVFEPNNAETWSRAKATIGSFLNDLWRDGALQGTSPEEAYFVNVGLGTSMDSSDILEGRMIVEVGIAAVRPAEFIILKFMHKLQES